MELERTADGSFSLGFGGDTFLAAIAFANRGAEVSLATALGEDTYSDAALRAAAEAGVGAGLVLRVTDRLPCLCLAERDENGNRRCEFWRDASPARQLFELPGWDRIAEELVGAKLVYLSGTTLSLYTNVGLGRLLAALEFGRERGTMIAFDANWSPRHWRNDEQRARAVYAEALKRSDIVLPSFADESKLWSDANPAATIDRLTTFGVREIFLRNGVKPALVHFDRQSVEVTLATGTTVEGTRARCALNAAYLVARLKGEAPDKAAQASLETATETVAGSNAPVAVAHKNGDAKRH